MTESMDYLNVLCKEWNDSISPLGCRLNFLQRTLNLLIVALYVDQSSTAHCQKDFV